MRGLLIGLIVVGLSAIASEARAANQKVTFTKTSGAQQDICVILTVGGVTSDWLQLVDGYRYSLATVQNQFNVKFGAGKLTLSYPSTTSVMVEFTGAYADQVVSYTHVGRYIDEGGGTGVSTQYTATLTQAGSAATPPVTTTAATNEKLAELLTAINANGTTLTAISATLTAINTKLATAEAEDARQTFLFQSLAQTMGLICGGLLWRTIVVAARLK